MKISIHKKPQVIVTVILLAWGSLNRATSKPSHSPKQVAEIAYCLTGDSEY